ncbi:MAG TPA: hypothetical protein VGY49_07135 [Burkholderiaceae bacterium]|jgi:hypothetical protein|nr:hypothetical protein [Burkholderiaceae bacterium]
MKSFEELEPEAGGFVQVPLQHDCPDVQTLPQLPQLCGSVCGSMQALPHHMLGAGQVQEPFWQIEPAGQTVPQ